ncbi:MAG: YraN family protein [Lachnospiraceae bacterium]|nr:YraN family protein [Lachnospiraceae bacterium]
MGEKNKREIGSRYEQKAVSFLKQNGYRILETNYRNRYGEIDIIASKESCLIFVEVKYRASHQYGDPLEAVDQWKQGRISRSALYYCSKRPDGMEIPCRFDVIALDGDHQIRHIENAFEYTE